MEVAVALYGPFQFEDGKRPISPILWLCPQEDVTFLKTINVILPHTLIDLSPEDVELFGIHFAKADHNATTLVNGKRRYVFRQYEATVLLNRDQVGSYATLKADHCCFWCLQMNKQDKVSPDIARRMASKMGYFIHCIECLKSLYPFVSPPRDVIYFCASYFLETCMKVHTMT